MMDSQHPSRADISNPPIYNRQLQKVGRIDDADERSNSDANMHKLQPHNPSSRDGHEVRMSQLWRDNDLEGAEVPEVRTPLQVPEMWFHWAVITWRTSSLASRYSQRVQM